MSDTSLDRERSLVWPEESCDDRRHVIAATWQRI
jgi:hypothetical protein